MVSHSLNCAGTRPMGGANPIYNRVGLPRLQVEKGMVAGFAIPHWPNKTLNTDAQIARARAPVSFVVRCLRCRRVRVMIAKV